ncbi:MULTISPECIES: ABC transporter ATP-binding protein [Kosakonia]|uniref:ABC transporter ATP-binding protein n=1 Tax=Kosakonia TaxID=1330547 RepID=UPI0005F0835D|nr:MULTISPECIES: ABC transporter ATP-binding protein [Kosakonia]MCZ3383128.1 ABC transporter ATP-binding protein [Kosakonia sp. SOY2]PDO87966.1 ABC transporter ATP-binding protein [Kosakonia sacchari]QHM96218.1 ABC transporter ATP-binding protein [Kosakonia sacchari]RCX00099.1 peptide/nickel transport system ATP-binding protein [Kosakonia sp. AG348]
MTTIPFKEAAPVLRLHNLEVQFAGSPVSVLDRISLSVKSGETLALVGESGCGKSITSLALMGLLPASAQILGGEMQFRGRNLRQLTAREYADLRGNELAMIFQEPMTSLNPAFTLGDQLSEAVIRHQNVSANAAREAALHILEKVQIPAAEMRLKAYPHQLSGGMRQRVMIAMALINKPRLLIADEPTTALDVTIQAQILALLNTLKAETGTAVLMITHDLGVVAEVAQQVAVMYAGQVVEQGSVEAIFADPQHPYTIGLMGSIPSLGARKGQLSTIPGAVPLPEAMPQGCRFATRCPFAQARCQQQKPPLTPQGKGHLVACFRVPLEQHIALGETA